MMLRMSRKPAILYSMILCGVLILVFVIVTALQSLQSPTSYECYASDPTKQMRPYKHKLDINITAHTPLLTAINQASTLGTLRQHQSSSQSSLDQLTSYLISKLACTFRMHDTRKAGDTVTAVWTAHSLAIYAQYNISALQTIYDDLTPQYRSLEAVALASSRSASPVPAKRCVLSAHSTLGDVMYHYAGWDGEWRNYKESRHFAEKRKQEIGIAEWESRIVGDKKEEIRSLEMELKALEKAVSVGFARNGAGQNIVPASHNKKNNTTTIIPILTRTISVENSSCTGTGRTWLLVVALT